MKKKIEANAKTCAGLEKMKGKKALKNTESQYQDNTTTTNGTDNRLLSKTQSQFPEQVTATQHSL